MTNRLSPEVSEEVEGIVPESAVKPLSLDVSEQLEGIVPESTVRPLTPCPNRSNSLEVSEQLEGILLESTVLMWVNFACIYAFTY